ncbi:MAG: amino acid ABC transporter permease [Actinomycetota bacterium]|nr:amino acid ABC transporter permease [Actinomycetota bacterium]MDH4352568.1 amino acid ABC transporter permease [Actinomycetota bacterium]
MTESPGPVVDPARLSVVRRKGRRDMTVATVSTVLFFLVLGYVVASAPGWPAVQASFFNLDDARASWPKIWPAFLLNVKIFLIAEPIILALALTIAVLRGLRAPVLAPLRVVATIYTDIIRGIPTILLVFLMGFGVPALQLQGLTNSELFWGTVALIVSYSAYVAEVFRAGIESVHPSQRAAARSLGLNNGQGLRYVILPQAVRRVVPPLLNDFISLQKDTALVSLLGVVEVFNASTIYANSTFTYTSLVVAALLFIALTVPMARFTDWVSARMSRQQQG